MMSSMMISKKVNSHSNWMRLNHSLSDVEEEAGAPRWAREVVNTDRLEGWSWDDVNADNGVADKRVFGGEP